MLQQQKASSLRMPLIVLLLVLQCHNLSAQGDDCSSVSCNCVLNNGVLDISCNSTPTLTTVPTLTNLSLQTSVTELRVRSSMSTSNGPLRRLPTNLCSEYPNVQILDLSYNSITGPVNTSELACLGSRLVSIDLSHNDITEIDRNFFRDNRQLRSINMAFNQLTDMPMIDADRFVNFPNALKDMNFSNNAITTLDLWPLFVKTGSLMTIDLSNNNISEYINEVPIFVKQFEEPPDPRNINLQNNRIQRVSDLLLQQYGACSTLSQVSTSYFVVGISNMLLTGNPLICDCESYYLANFIKDRLNDFPQIYNGQALITQALCTEPPTLVNQSYFLSDFDAIYDCANYVLPNMTDKFCSVYDNQTSLTIAPPTYWTSTTAPTTTDSGGGSGGSGGSGTSNSGGSNGSVSSNAPNWYIILGIVLGCAVIIAVLATIGYLFRDRIFPEKCRSKLGIRGRNGIGHPNGIYQSIGPGSDGSSPRGSQYDPSHDNSSSAQGTQTALPIERVKPVGTAGAASKRKGQPIDNDSSFQKGTVARRLSASKAADVSTNTNNVVRGIPIGSSKPLKVSPTHSNGNDTSVSELSVKSIPMGASKRAKLLPQVKSGMYVDTNNVHLLNTSAGGLASQQRQRRRSAAWLRKQAQSHASPLPARPQSMIAQKTSFDHDGSFDQDLPPIPTIESVTEKPPKPLRTLPLLNITVVPAWIGDEDAEVAGVTGKDAESKE